MIPVLPVSDLFNNYKKYYVMQYVVLFFNSFNHYQLRRQDQKIIIDSKNEILFHDNVPLFVYNFQERIKELVNKDFFDVNNLACYSTNFAPACRHYDIVNNKYSAKSKILSEKDIYCIAEENIGFLKETFKNCLIGIENTNGYQLDEYSKIIEPEIMNNVVEENDIFLTIDIAHAELTATWFEKETDIVRATLNYLNKFNLSRIIEIHLSSPDINKRVDTHENFTLREIEILLQIEQQIPDRYYVVVEYYKNIDKLIYAYNFLRR